MSKKKQPKKKPGPQRSTYAKGKKPGEGKKKPAKKAAPRKAVPGKEDDARPSRARTAKERSEPQREQWNLIKSGTLEMRVFKWLLILLVLVSLLQYPLFSAYSDFSYPRNVREWEEQMREWEQTYPTEEERKEHEDEMPAEPRKPGFTDFLLFQVSMFVLQGGLLLFIGLNTQRRTDLRTPLLDGVLSGESEGGEVGDLLKYAVPGALVAVVPLVVYSLIARAAGLTQVVEVQQTSTEVFEYATWKGALSAVAVSVNFVFMFLLLIMSALVWVMHRYGSKLKLEPHWTAIGLSSLVAFGYLVVTRMAGVDVMWALVLNSALVAVSIVWVLGYLYWKKGLEYALLAGIIGFGLFPFLERLIIK